jgi:hypothetical protein
MIGAKILIILNKNIISASLISHGRQCPYNAIVKGCSGGEARALLTEPIEQVRQEAGVFADYDWNVVLVR